MAEPNPCRERNRKPIVVRKKVTEDALVANNYEERMPPNVKHKFSGHQTFVFRYGWLEKGVRFVDGDASAFTKEDALVELGVGKNMVESIRHWCQVTQMVDEDPEVKRNNGRVLRATPIAQKLLLDGGWDPFLEDDASLWLIHWLLVSNPAIVTTWQIVFSLFQRPDASKREIVDFVAAYAEKHAVEINEGSLSRDVDCFFRTYAAARTSSKQGVVVEESFDCPLQELNLLQASPDGEIYRFAIGSKPSLPAAVFGFALAQYFERARGDVKTMSIQECLYGIGSPGQAFKLDENTLIEHIEELDRLTHGKIILDETAGLKQIYRKEPIVPMKLLAGYYATAG
jgi:hypothetical protein